jgi:hypothetical protein
MSKIDDIFRRCKAGVYITHNENKCYYQTLEEYFISNNYREDVTDDVYNGMLERDSMISIQMYIRTPVGFAIVFHYDLEKALDDCLDYLNEVAKNEKQD